MISAYVNESHSNWDENLNILAFAYNTSVHGSTGCTPFEITYGYKPKVPLDLMISEIELDLQLTPGEYAANLQATFDTAYKHVASNRDLKMDRAKINHDRQIRAANFDIHDQVKLINTAIDKTQTKKFKKKWVGPYKIVAKVGNDYVIKPISKKGKAKTVNQNKLQRFHPRAEQRPTQSNFNTIPEIKEEEAQHERLQAETRKKAKRPACQRQPRQKITTNDATISKDAEPLPPTKSGRIRKPIDRFVPGSKK